MEWNQLKKQLLNDYKEFKSAYETVDVAFEVGRMITEARLIKNVTQARLAELVGTKQPSIARIEKGSQLPSLGFLEKIATALGTKLIPPTFEIIQQHNAQKQLLKYSYSWHNAHLNKQHGTQINISTRLIGARSTTAVRTGEVGRLAHV